FCDKRCTVKASYVGNLQNFHGFKRGQIHPGNPGGIVPVDEQPSSVKFTVLLGKLNMVGVIPRHKSIRSVEHGLGFFVIAITIFGKLGKYGDFLKHSARRNTIDSNLSTESSG